MRTPRTCPGTCPRTVPKFSIGDTCPERTGATKVICWVVLLWTFIRQLERVRSGYLLLLNRKLYRKDFSAFYDLHLLHFLLLFLHCMFKNIPRGAPCHTPLKTFCVPMNVWDISSRSNDVKRDYNKLTACLQDRWPGSIRLNLTCGNSSYGEPVDCGRNMLGGNERLLIVLLLSVKERFILMTRMHTPNAL